MVPDASIPRARKNPLTWQNVDSLATGPVVNTTTGYSMNQRALNISLCISNIMRLPEFSMLPLTACCRPTHV